MPFPKTYRTTLGWAVSAGAIIALIAGQGTIARSAIIGLTIAGELGTIWAAWEHKWLRTKLRAVLILVATSIGMFLFAWMAWPSTIVPPPNPPPTIAVFVKCDMIGLPIEISAQDAVRVVPVNKKGMKSLSWGSFEIRNDSKEPRLGQIRLRCGWRNGTRILERSLIDVR